jgi:PKD repeat protein
MKMFRNYDGNKSAFGDTSVRAISTANADNLSVFAAERSSDGALTIMIISKVLSGSTPVTINVSNFAPGAAAQVWQLTSANAITRFADAPLSGQSLSGNVPAQSVTLLVIPASGGPVNQPPVADFIASPASGVAPLPVSFDASLSSDPDGTIGNYSWAFGDGATGTGLTTSHTYAAAGTYDAVLTVRDNLNATATKTVSISVSPGATPPAAPSNLTGSVSGSNVTLRWTDNASNESGFYVERAAKGKTLQFSRIATLGSNVATWTMAQPSGQWIYRVQAYNATGASGYTNTVTLRVR